MRAWPLLLVLVSAPALAQFDIRNTLDSQLSVYLYDDKQNPGDIQALDNVLSTELEASFNSGLRLFGQVDTRYEVKDVLEPGRPRQGSASKLNRRWLASDRAELELRELYIDGYVGDTFFRLGKQQVVWGQADGLQVLDVVNPMRYREFISDEIENRRIPLWTANIEFPVQQWMMQLIWIPDQTYHSYPETGAEYAITSSKLSPELSGAQTVILDRQDAPERFFKDSDAGFRMTGFIGGWDVGLSYLYQYNNSRAVSSQRQSESLTISSKYVRTHLLGASLAKAFGSFSVRGEIGYLSDAVALQSPTLNNHAKQDITMPELKAVIGIDYNGISDTLLSMQLFSSHISATNNYLIRDDTEQQISFLVKRDFFNQTLSIDGLLVHSLNDRDGYWHLYANYGYRSDISFSIGVDTYYGDSWGVFGQFKGSSRASVGFTYSF